MNNNSNNDETSQPNDIATQMKLSSIISKAAMAALAKVLKDLEYSKLRLELAQGVVEDTYWCGIGKELKKLYSEVQQLKISEHKIACVPYYWVTINPPSKYWDSRMPEGAHLFEKCIQKIDTWKNVALTAHSIEQRGENPSTGFRGLHCHLLIKTNMCQDEFELKRALKRKFKQFWTVQSEVDSDWAINNFHLLNIQRCRTDWVGDKIEYILGQKWHEDKISKLEMDKSFRSTNNIINDVRYEWANETALVKTHFMQKANEKLVKKVTKSKKKRKSKGKKRE